MPATLEDRINRLRAVKARLASPDEFWSGKAEEYRGILAECTVRELTPLQPPDMEPEDWQYQVQILAGGIQSELLAELETGLKFSIAPASQPQMEEIVGPAPGVFGLETITQWIDAGREGDQAGKHLDERDWGRDDAEIAKRVWWAMYTGRSLHSHDLIRKFLVERGVQLVKEALPFLVKAWRESLIVRVKEDWKAYLRQVAMGRTEAPF